MKFIRQYAIIVFAVLLVGAVMAVRGAEKGVRALTGRASAGLH